MAHSLRPLGISDPIGTKVILLRDNGALMKTKVRYPVEKRGDYLVVFLEGVTGYYLASRCWIDE